MSRVLIVLGAPNDEAGRLSLIAHERLGAAATLYARHPEARIILTGGFGEHFNRSPVAHAELAKRHLVELGVPESAFVEPALSGNTVEDAELTRPIVDGLGLKDVVVVTSNFHVERARAVFEERFSGYRLEFVGAFHDGEADELAALAAWEREALARLRGAG